MSIDLQLIVVVEDGEHEEASYDAIEERDLVVRYLEAQGESDLADAIKELKHYGPVMRSVFNQNVTYNLAPMFYTVLGGSIRKFDGFTGAHAVPVLEAGIKTMNSRWEELEAVELEGARRKPAERVLKLLKRMLEVSAAHPKGLWEAH